MTEVSTEEKFSINENHSLSKCLFRLDNKIDVSAMTIDNFKDNDLDFLLDGIISTLLNFGVYAKKNIISMDESTHIETPCIVRWNLKHFVILNKIDDKGFHVWDPCLGERNYRVMEFFEFSKTLGIQPYTISLIIKSDIEKISILENILDKEKKEERKISGVFTVLSAILCIVNKRLSLNFIRLLCVFWDKLFTPDIFLGPSRNIEWLLNTSPEKTKKMSRHNIANLAFNMGYTGYLLKTISRSVSIDKLDDKIRVPIITDNQQPLIGQCIIELLHINDPVTAVYNCIRNLPTEHDIVIFGNPWHEDMVGICEKAAKENNISLEFIPPAGRTSFLRLMKRALKGAHVILFADGSPLFSSNNNTGMQLARSFAQCTLWGRKAYLTSTGALLTQRTGANLYVAGLLNEPNLSMKLVSLSEDNESDINTLMQRKSAAMQDIISLEPSSWLFWRNAEVYFHDYSSAYSLNEDNKL